MWLFLWVVFVLTAAGFFLWSYHAIYEQKKAWKAYAERFGLQYVPGQIMDSPSMSGEIKGRAVNFYPQITDSPTGQKIKQNVVEVFLNEIPDMLCVVASTGFADFVTLLELPEPFHLENPKWPQNLLSRTLEEQAPELWFAENEKRIEAIEKLSKLPFDFAFVADGEQCFIAARSTNPLDNEKKLNKLLGVIFEACKNLEYAQDQSSKTEKPKDESETSESETEESNP